jgi:3D (Asp-Asp-Asp) domain-containing protein
MLKTPHILRLLPMFLIVVGCSAASASRKPPIEGRYAATAYSVTGITAAGTWTHRHVIAADPDLLPIGSRIKVLGAGKYSGEYVVADTGTKIVGRKLDIYLPSTPECKKFGVKPVRVKVIELGDGTHQNAKAADAAVKQDVAKDISKGRVGNAATEQDWAAKTPATKAAIVRSTSQTPPPANAQQAVADTAPAPTPKP